MEPTTYTQEYFDDLLLDADSALARSDPKEAKNILSDILCTAPTFSIAHHHLGWLYMNCFRNYTMAESHLRLAIKFKPAYPPAFHLLGSLKILTGELEDAEKILRQGLKYEGINAASVFHEMGKIHEIKGKYFAARKYYKLAIRNCMDNQQMSGLLNDLKRCRLKFFLL